MARSEQDALEAAQNRFILEWGRMSSSWGVNRTMAQIQALLFIEGKPLSVDQIIDRLCISRGNASMNLRDLMDWGIVRRFRMPGERKDTYISETDPWLMLARVARERKRRELDPTAAAIREALSSLPDSEQAEDAQLFRQRLNGLLEIFNLAEAIYQKVLFSDRDFSNVARAFLTQTGT